jgi:hypothetical protein
MTLDSQPQPAPGEFIEWFRQELDLAGREIQIFIDLDTDLEIGVFRNTPTIRERLRAPTPRQPLPSSPQPRPAEQQRSSSQSQEYGSDLDETVLTQLEKSIRDDQLQPQPQQQQQPVDLQTLVYTTSGKNKARMKRRVEKEAKRQGAGHNGRGAKATTRTRRARRAQLSAARVVLDSEDEAMMESDGALEEELVDPWFRDFPSDKRGTLLTRTTQAKIKRRAMAITGPEVVEDWQAFMASWRENGFLTSRPTSRNSLVVPKRLDNLPVEIADFYYAYNRVKTTEIADSFKAITHRFRMARLWMLYSRAEDVEIQDPAPLQLGQTKQAQRKRFLFDLLHPTLGGVTDIDANRASKKPWDAFTNRLRFAKRWYTLQEELGYGVLALIPERVVPNRWVQKELNVAEFAIWIQAIKHFRPGYEKAVQHWRKTIEHALNGLRPSRQMKTIEGITPADLKGYGDTTTLFYDDEESEDGNLPPSNQVIQPCESRRDVMSFLGDMGLEGANQGLFFTEEEQAVFNTLDPQQIQRFGVLGASQETMDSILWSEDRTLDEADEGNPM